jgi:hypothetical protein
VKDLKPKDRRRIERFTAILGRRDLTATQERKLRASIDSHLNLWDVGVKGASDATRAS